MMPGEYLRIQTDAIHFDGIEGLRRVDPLDAKVVAALT
jgi:hypothetical protein